jgi:hypothetical protein
MWHVTGEALRAEKAPLPSRGRTTSVSSNNLSRAPARAFTLTVRGSKKAGTQQ